MKILLTNAASQTPQHWRVRPQIAIAIAIVIGVEHLQLFKVQS